MGRGDGFEGGVLDVEGFEGEEGAAEVAVGDSGEEGGDVGGKVEVFLLRDAGEDSAHLRGQGISSEMRS